jgi:hypothetical protein
MTTDDESGKAIPRDLRLRTQFFPDAEKVIFDTTNKAYGPLPILLRKLLKHVTPPELRLLIYLYTRSSKYRICYPTLEEISDEIGVNRKNLTAPLKKLEAMKLIATHRAGGRRYFLVHDPRVAIQHLVDTGVIKDDELFMTNELASELKQNQFKSSAAKSVTKK